MSRKPGKFNKYHLYQNSVQAPEADAEFFRDLYRRLRGRPAKSLREDFCGTFSNLCAWVKLNPNHVGYGVDLDREPLTYGLQCNLPRLKPEQQERVHVIQGNVLKVRLPKVDLVTALNFSYFVMHSRAQLKTYYRRALSGLNPQGLFIVDCFGGSDCQGPIVDRMRKRGFWYFWDQESYWPVSHRAKFHIHFKRDGERKRERVFSYDWRMWSIPEVREIMAEAGFRRTVVYWEGNDGVFRPAEKGEPCAAWIAYIIGIK